MYKEELNVAFLEFSVTPAVPPDNDRRRPFLTYVDKPVVVPIRWGTPEYYRAYGPRCQTLTRAGHQCPQAVNSPTATKSGEIQVRDAQTGLLFTFHVCGYHMAKRPNAITFK